MTMTMDEIRGMTAAELADAGAQQLRRLILREMEHGEPVRLDDLVSVLGWGATRRAVEEACTWLKDHAVIEEHTEPGPTSPILYALATGAR